MNSNLFTTERRREILTQLKLKKKLLVTDLCEQYNVSQTTIRTDLTALEKDGLLKRTHGGAILNAAVAYELNSFQKEEKNIEEKIRIARFAAEQIHDHEIIALDTGTTTYCLAELLDGKKGLTVVTTDIRIAALLENKSDITVILAGGLLRKGFSCTIGAITNSILSAMTVDTVFLASNAVSLDGQLCTPDIEQAQVKKTMIHMASHRVLLCDSSKFGTNSFAAFANLKDIDLTITDAGISNDLLNIYRRKKYPFEVV